MQELSFPGMAGPTARVTDPDTSLEAGREAWKRRGPLQQRVLDALRTLGPSTDDELVAHLRNAHPGSVAKRRGELVDEGVVEATDQRRQSRWGRDCIVWKLTNNQERHP